MRWHCDDCGTDFSLKRNLIDHLLLEREASSETISTVEYQLDELGYIESKEE